MSYQTKYQKLDYFKYQKILFNIFTDERLNQLGRFYQFLGNTEYHYPIETISLGYGKKEIFVIGTTHGSEVISLDFILQLIKNLPNMPEFDPNIYKIIFLPLHNPEGYDISSSAYCDITDDNFHHIAYEYYNRYRIDTLINYALESLNIFLNHFIDEDQIITASKLLNRIKHFIQTNVSWSKLSQDKNLPQIHHLNKKIKDIQKIDDFNTLKSTLLKVLDESTLTLSNSPKDIYYHHFIQELKKGFQDELIWKHIDHQNRQRLHQKMFQDANFNHLSHHRLKKEAISMYQDKRLPKGSQITHDANGSGVNLNANTKLNPGIKILQNNIIQYMNPPRDNIIHYFKGPIGLPTCDVNNFTYEKENIYLYQLLKESYQKGRYLCTLLYHSTGGMIYHKPNEEFFKNYSQYQEFMIYNQLLAETYQKSTSYRLLDSHSKTGVGDYLRGNFPGVLLIELSKMGGNPLGPYGDEDNIHKTINDNLLAFEDLLKLFNKYLKNTSLKKTRSF